MVDKRTTLDALGRRQFIFTNLPVEVPSGWHSVALGTGFILHHCPLLCVISVVDRSGRQWALLGHAFEVTESRQNPAAEISLASTENVSKLVATWSGRWLLISSAAIIPDVGALLGAYIHKNDQGMIISGSVTLLASILNLPIRDSRLIGWYGFNWFPGPLSKLEQVRKLLPDQIYNPEPRRVQFFDRLPIIPGNTLEDTAEILIRGLVRVFRAMSQLKGGTPTLLALTAGLDSRTSFSILQASGVPFETFTLQHSRISKADTILPAEISARYGIPYRYVIGGRLKREKLNQYDRHTYYCAIDGEPIAGSKRVQNQYSNGRDGG